MSVRWLRLVGGTVLAVGGMIPAATRFGVLSAGDPMYLATSLVCVGLGLLCIVTSFRRSKEPRRGWLMALGRYSAFALAVGIAAILIWLRPFVADDAALGAMISDDQVKVTDNLTEIRLDPVAASNVPGVIFQPGARVDARAYAKILRKLAGQGHRVIILKQPFGIAFTANGESAEVAGKNPNPNGWYVAGHSLGGTVAAMEVADSPLLSGLILWASYPASDISGLGKPVISISGTNDGLSTPAKIEESRADLPPGTRMPHVQGATHAYFGDYGEQPGDGEPGVGRETAQNEIAAASHEFLGR